MKKNVAEIIIYTLSTGVSLLCSKVAKIAYLEICKGLGWEKSYSLMFLLTIIYGGFIGYAFSLIFNLLKEPKPLKIIQKTGFIIIAIVSCILIFGLQALVDIPDPIS